MEQIEKSTSAKRQMRSDRVALSPECNEKVGRWLDGLKERFKGLKISRSELINWVLMNRPNVLDQSEAQQIHAAFFDEIHFASWALKELRKARAAGQSQSLAEILGQVESLGKSRHRVKRSPKRQFENSKDAAHEQAKKMTRNVIQELANDPTR